jgi:hypothetical protein
MWSAVLNFVASVLIHPPHRRIALPLELVFQMMVKLFAALTHKAQVILLGACDQPEDCAKGYEQPAPVLPGVEEAKRGRFAYLDCRSENLHPALLGISISANMEA